MKSKTTKILALTAALFGLHLSAATPVAVWDGDFTGAEGSSGKAYGSYSIKANGNTVAQDGSYIQISGSYGVLLDWPAPSNDFSANGNITILVKYSNLTAAGSNNRAMGTLWAGDASSQKDLVGSYTPSTGVLANIWNGATDSRGTKQNKTPATAGKFSFDFSGDATPKGSTTYICAAGESTFAEACSGNGTLFATTKNFYGAAIGGTRAAAGALASRTNMRIEAVAIFNTRLTAAELAAYKFPSELLRNATVSGTCSWSTLGWSPAWESGAAQIANITVSDTATLTVDSAQTMYTLKVTSESGKLLTLKNVNNITASSIDFSAAAGKVDLGLDAIEDLAKNAAAGAPYSYWLFKGANVTGESNIKLPTMPIGYTVTLEKVSGYGCRLVVKAPATAKFGSVNINIGNPSFASGTNYGLYPAKGSEWHCYTSLTGNDNYTTFGVVRITANCYQKVGTASYGIDTLNSTTDAQKIFKHNMQDAAGEERGFTLKGISGFASKYRVIVYMSSDTQNWGFAPVIISQYQGSEWNPVTYAGPTFQENKVGYTIKGSTATRWGWANNNASHCSLDQAEGVNAIVSDVMTADNIVIKSPRPSDNGLMARGSIAAIQIVKVGEANVTYTATVSGNTSWSNISWTPPDGSTPVTTANLPDSGVIQVTISSGATLTITAADVARLTEKNIALKATQFTNNGTIRFEGGEKSTPIAYTADGDLNKDLGNWTLAENTYVLVTPNDNKIYKVTGEDASSCCAFTRSDAGFGFAEGSSFNNLTIVCATTNDKRLWIERGIGNNVRLDIASGDVHVSGSNYNPTFVALSGTGTLSRENNNEVTVNCAEASDFSGTCSIPVTIGGTALQIISSGSKFTGALTVTSGATLGLKSASPSSLTAQSGAHLIVGANTSAAAIQVSTSQGVNLEGATIDIDTFGETAISEEKATYKLISANGGFSKDTMILGDSLTKGNWAVTVVGTELQAQKKTDSHYITIDPTTGEATHDTTSRLALDIDRTWIDEKCGTAGKSAEEVTAALNETAANGTKPWESYVLGLDPNVETSVPVIQPAQAASSNGAIAFQLSNVAVNAKAGADVTYKVVTLSAPGGSAIESSESAAPGETISVALPTSGVTYYKLQVDIQ